MRNLLFAILVLFGASAAKSSERHDPRSISPRTPQVEWRTPDADPILISNVGSSEQRALRIELRFLAR